MLSALRTILVRSAESIVGAYYRLMPSWSKAAW